MYPTDETQSYYGEIQEILADELVTNNQTDQSAIRSTLNNHIEDDYIEKPYDWKWITASSDPTVIANNFYSSLMIDYAPVINVNTAKLSYYGGYSTGHYVTITGTDLGEKTIVVMDSNVNSSKKYFGTHIESYANVRNAMVGRTMNYVVG